MRRWIAVVVALVAALPAAANAEPKTITIDGCAKVEIGPQDVCFEKQCLANPASKTVKCTGEAIDPEVRKPFTGITSGQNLILTPGSNCIRGDGRYC